jgi:hypothetical protein
MPIHLLIDWENKQPTAAELEQVRGGRFRLWIMHGPQQVKLGMEHATAMQPLGKHVKYVQSPKAGKNALDLLIAFCVGEASANDRYKESSGCYIIISGDKGFEPLLDYLEGRDIWARRAESLAEALKVASEYSDSVQPKLAAKPALSGAAQRVIENLRPLVAAKRPSTARRLTNHVTTLLGKEGTEQEVARVLEELKRVGVVTFNGTKAGYKLP